MAALGTGTPQAGPRGDLPGYLDTALKALSSFRELVWNSASQHSPDPLRTCALTNGPTGIGRLDDLKLGPRCTETNGSLSVQPPAFSWIDVIPRHPDLGDNSPSTPNVRPPRGSAGRRFDLDREVPLEPRRHDQPLLALSGGEGRNRSASERSVIGAGPPIHAAGVRPRSLRSIPSAGDHALASP